MEVVGIAGVLLERKARYAYFRSLQSGAISIGANAFSHGRGDVFCCFATIGHGA